MRRAQRVDPPLRVAISAGLGRLDFREQLVHAALEVAQHGVDQSLRARVPEQDGRLDRLMHHCMRGLRPRRELRERREKQPAQSRIGERPLQ